MPLWLSKAQESYDKRFGDSRQFLKFCAVGVGNTAIGYGVFSLLFLVFKLPLLVSYDTGFMAAVINSYILNRLWTFREVAGKRSMGQALRFFVVTLSALVLSSVLLLLLEPLMPALVAAVVVMGIAVVYNYFASKLLVFRD